MTAIGIGRGVRTARSGALLDSLYLLAVISAVVFGGPAQLAVALPVAGVLGLRAVHRRRGAASS